MSNWVKQKAYKAIKDSMEKYIFGFKEDNLKVGLLSGEVELNNLVIDPKAVNDDFLDKELPYRLKAGLIGKVTVKVSLVHVYSITSIGVGVESLFGVDEAYD